jgi:hypothetical protein
VAGEKAPCRVHRLPAEEQPGITRPEECGKIFSIPCTGIFLRIDIMNHLHYCAYAISGNQKSDPAIHTPGHQACTYILPQRCL